MASMALMRMLSRAFPPPRFMTLPSVGVDISDASLKYVQFRRGHRNNLILERWGDVPIPGDTMRRGDLIAREGLVKTLQTFREKVDVPYIRVSLPEERAYLFETTVPRISARDIRNMLEFKLEENVPLSPRDALFDFAVVSDDPKDAELRVSVAVYARETIMGYFGACTDAGLIPVSFEVEAQAIARATVPTGDLGTYMIVDFGQTRTGVGIMHRGALMFTSTVDIGGAQLSEVLRRSIGVTDESKLTHIKNEEGLLRTEHGKDVYTALLSPVSALKDELSTRINYWNLRGEGTQGREIKQVILCGGSANLAGLPEYLTEELGIEVVRAHVWQNAFSFSTFVPPITRRYSYGYATAVGLALTDFTSQRLYD